MDAIPLDKYLTPAPYSGATGQAGQAMAENDISWGSLITFIMSKSC